MIRSSIIFFIAVSTCINLSAQGVYNDGGILSISQGTIFSLPDSIVNKGTLINNGQMIIAGSWINTGTYDAGQGEVQFNSDIDQQINHNAQSMEKLVISGGGKKEFLADIFVQSQLTLTDGILVSQNGARIIMDRDATIVGGSNTSHVNGPVERKGTGDWLFPIGDGTIYLPVYIYGVADPAAFGIVTLHVIGNETLTIDESLDQISTKRYFEFASGGDIGQSIINLPASDEDLNGTLVIAVSNNASGPYINQPSKTPFWKYYALATPTKEHRIIVYNAVSSGNDGKNDFMTIENIQYFPNNKLLIVNRWGDQVFEATGYDNNQRSFKGYSDKGNKLPSGTYYYILDLGDGSEKLTGYLVLK